MNEDQMVQELREAIRHTRATLGRYEKALAALEEDTPTPTPRNSGRAPGRPRKSEGTRRKRGISEEKLRAIATAIYRYAEDHEEFRQVDIRGLCDMNSATAALAFEALRQRNMIRLARVEGVNKWFRLTREVVTNGNGPTLIEEDYREHVE